MEQTRKEKVAILEVTQKCNQNCVFCLDEARKGARDAPLRDILRQIETVAREGAKRVIFMTGEPLLRKDIGQVLDFLKEMSLEVCITTNGTLLARKERLDFLLEHSVFQYNISVHTCKKDVASAISSKSWTFERQALALENLNEASKVFQHLRVYTKTVVSAMNYDHMDETAQFLKDKLRDVRYLQLGFKMMRAVNPTQSRLIVPFQVLKPYLDRLGSVMSSETWLVFDGFPLCALGDFAFLAREVEDLLEFRTYQKVPDDVLVMEQVADGYEKGDECKSCSLDAVCFGAHHESVSYMPKPWFSPSKTSAEIVFRTAVQRLPAFADFGEIPPLLDMARVVRRVKGKASPKVASRAIALPILLKLGSVMKKLGQVGGERVIEVRVEGDCLHIVFSGFVVWVTPSEGCKSSLFSGTTVALGYSGNESEKAVAVTKKVFHMVCALEREKQ
jgi:organic radical activating enzyme